MTLKLGVMAQNHFVQATHNILSTMEHAKSNVEMLLDDLPQVFFVIDIFGQVVKANRQASILFSCDGDEPLGHDISELFSAETRSRFLQLVFAKPPHGARDVHFDLAIDGLVNRLEFSWRAQLFSTTRNASDVHYAIFGSDMTEFRELQKSKADLESRLKKLGG